MLKALIADDEAVIVRGLRRLIDWEALGISIVGESTDGLSAERIMLETKPDLVISDIEMPGLSGLELMARGKAASSPKFIFVSGYEKFEYAREALSGGAVDYLLKPVSAESLEKAVRKALGLMAESSAAAALRHSSLPLQQFFSQLTENREFAGAELFQNFTSLLGGKNDPVFMGLCFGLTEETEKELDSLPYERRLLQTFIAFNSIRDDLEYRGYGCFLRKDQRNCCMLGIFSPNEDPLSILADSIDRISTKTGLNLRVGIGRFCRTAGELKLSYEDSIHALDLYYFSQKRILHWEGQVHVPQSSNEDFDESVMQVFHSIVTKSGELENNVDRVLSIIADLHYGNKTAAFNRVMVFTGDLCQLLYANKLLTGSFSQRQDALQKSLESCGSYSELCQMLRSYYLALSRDIYITSNRRSTQEIYKVQQYILEHYNEELSLKTLAEIACVSHHYFSAFFKAETGQNYKAFLTRIRMENALDMVLNSDAKTYEIAEKVGYNNVRRFVDAFRAAYGMSPADYRKSHKK